MWKYKETSGAMSQLSFPSSSPPPHTLPTCGLIKYETLRLLLICLQRHTARVSVGAVCRRPRDILPLSCPDDSPVSGSSEWQWHSYFSFVVLLNTKIKTNLLLVLNKWMTVILKLVIIFFGSTKHCWNRSVSFHFSFFPYLFIFQKLNKFFIIPQLHTVGFYLNIYQLIPWLTWNTKSIISD